MYIFLLIFQQSFNFHTQFSSNILRLKSQIKNIISKPFNLSRFNLNIISLRILNKSSIKLQPPINNILFLSLQLQIHIRPQPYRIISIPLIKEILIIHYIQKRLNSMYKFTTHRLLLIKRNKIIILLFILSRIFPRINQFNYSIIIKFRKFILKREAQTKSTVIIDLMFIFIPLTLSTLILIKLIRESNHLPLYSKIGNLSPIRITNPYPNTLFLNLLPQRSNNRIQVRIRKLAIIILFHC